MVCTNLMFVESLEFTRGSMDMSGPQQVRAWQYANGWMRVQSLSHGREYYHRVDSKGDTSFKEPREVQNVKPVVSSFQDQGSSFIKPPGA